MSKNKIKVFDYCWHIPHQWDMVNALKNDCEFYFCLNVKRSWDTKLRPLPKNISFVCHYEKGFYDIAILHIDQQIISTDHQKRLIFDQFNSIVKDIPKVILNHGSPVFPERFFELGMILSKKEMEKRCIEIVRDLVKDNVMVVNSKTAASDKEWGFGYPIIHGINPSEWYDLPKEPRVFTALSPYGLSTYYNRTCMAKVAEILYNDFGYILHYANLNVDTKSSIDDYKRYLGSSLLYLDTSYRTPMNRARTEAFLSGCCVIQVENAHDLEYWAKPNENIIIVPNDPYRISLIIVDFLENKYQDAIKIGQAGKYMAMKEFSPKRYRKNWIDLFNDILKLNF